MNKYMKACEGCIYYSCSEMYVKKHRCILGKMKLNCKDRKEGGK